MTKVLAFAGSLRAASFNKRLVAVAAAGAEQAGADVTHLALNDYPLPLYDEDVEAAGFPDAARRLKELFLAHDALLIASPEYNSGFSGVLKNAIDWVSRPLPGEDPLACFRGKVCGLLAASRGGFGGMRGLLCLRPVLANIGVLVVPEQFALAKAHEAFAVDGALKDPKAQTQAQGVGRQVAEVASRLKTHAHAR